MKRAICLAIGLGLMTACGSEMGGEGSERPPNPYATATVPAPVDAERPRTRSAPAGGSGAGVQISEVHQRLSDSYGWPDGVEGPATAIESIEFEGVRSLRVETTLYDKEENAGDAEMICFWVNSVAREPGDWRITRVAASNGAYLAECEVLPGLR